MSMPDRTPTPYDGLRVATKEQGVAEPEHGADPERPSGADRMIPLRAILDALSMWLIAAGGGLGVAAAAVAGGVVPALATGAGVLIALGLLLTL